MPILTIALLLALGSADTSRTQQATDPITDGIHPAWATAKRHILRAAEQMPKGKELFRPVDSAMSFKEVLGHVADANYQLCSAGRGEKAPYVDGHFEKSATAVDTLQALKDSFAYCDEFFEALSDAKLPEIVPIETIKPTRFQIVVMVLAHMNEHYGNLDTYALMNGGRPHK